MAHADSLDEFWNTARASEEVFDPAQVASLPEPARRYLNHAIAPGTPLARAVRLRMHGQIKLKNWASFTAEEVIRWDRGMIWKATVKLYGVTISGFDRLVDGQGEMQWRLFGILPIIRGRGSDITRSAAGRVAAETIWLPSVLVSSDVRWSGIDATRSCAGITVSGESVEMEMNVNETGRLLSASMSRWGNPGGTQYRYEAFGAIVEEESSFSGYTIPTKLRIGWYFGTERFASEGEFFRCTVDHAAFR
jgi:hypothetical protein